MLTAVAFEEHAVGQVALVMYEYADSEYIGKQPPDDGSWHPVSCWRLSPAQPCTRRKG
jgi:hypothetical protein